MILFHDKSSEIMVNVLIDFSLKKNMTRFKVFCSLKDKLLWYMNDDIEALNLKYTKEITVSKILDLLFGIFFFLFIYQHHQ